MLFVLTFTILLSQKIRYIYVILEVKFFLFGTIPFFTRHAIRTIP